MKKKNFINVNIRLNEENYELAYANLMDIEFCGIEERVDELVISFDEEQWNSDIQNEIMNRLMIIDSTALILNVESIADKNWNEEWEKHIEPIQIDDKIVITPTWKADAVFAEHKVLINPKMSFGTGHHSTTRLCCRLMYNIVKPVSRWIDVGTGTGILAILAIKLGAEYCFAFDNNIWSVENSEENFKLNNVESKIDLSEQDIDSMDLPESDAIAANLFINLVLRIMDKFYAALKAKKGDLVLSGIMIYNKEEVLDEAKKAGFELIELITEDEWVAFHFRAN